jgi:hypothetical protein
MSQSYIPVAAVVPAFAGVELVQVPAEWNNSIPEDIWGVFKQSNTLTVRRHVKPFRKWCIGCPPCATQESSFSVYAGLTAGAQSEILRIDEVRYNVLAFY